MSEVDPRLFRLVTAVLKSPKYRHVTVDLIRTIGAEELVRRRRLREAIKATKNKLHQIGGAYLSAGVDYGRARVALEKAIAGSDQEALRQVCRQIMHGQASTRERLPVLDTFYETVLADLPPITSVMDIACGLNPLSWPWQPLAPGATYIAYDMYADLVDFLQAFFNAMRISGRAELRDVINRPPSGPVDLALLLKAAPCLEQVDRSATQRLLTTVQARYWLISYPAHSLGGRQKGMPEQYEAHFRSLIEGESWSLRRIAFESELVFLLHK